MVNIISMIFGGVVGLIIGCIYLEYKEVKQFRRYMGYTNLNILQTWIKKNENKFKKFQKRY